MCSICCFLSNLLDVRFRVFNLNPNQICCCLPGLGLQYLLLTHCFLLMWASAFYFASGHINLALPVTIVSVVTAQARLMDCVKQSNVLRMWVRLLHMQDKLSFSWLWPFPPLTAWNLNLGLWWWSTISWESKQQELVCVTRGQHVSKDFSLVRGQFRDMKTIKRNAFWCFIYFFVIERWSCT